MKKKKVIHISSTLREDKVLEIHGGRAGEKKGLFEKCVDHLFDLIER